MLAWAATPEGYRPLGSVAIGSRNESIGPDRRMCSEFSDSARRATSPEVRFVRGAQGISRSGPESGSNRDFVPLTLLGIRSGSARGAGRDAGRLLGVAAAWLRRSDPTDGPCSVFPAVMATLLKRPSKNAPQTFSSWFASRESGSLRHFMNQLRLCSRVRAVATQSGRWRRSSIQAWDTGNGCRDLSRGGEFFFGRVIASSNRILGTYLAFLARARTCQVCQVCANYVWGIVAHDARLDAHSTANGNAIPARTRLGRQSRRSVPGLG